MVKERIDGTGAIAINGGTLTGGGTVWGLVTNAALVQPGGAGTALGVTGDSPRTSAGSSPRWSTGPPRPGRSSPSWSSQRRGNPVRGTLAIPTGHDVDPPVGTTVQITVDAASRTGTFSTITGRDTLPAGKYWGVNYDATGVSLAGPAGSR